MFWRKIGLRLGVMISTWEVDNREILNNKRVISKSSFKISAIYPSNVINVLGANFPGYRGPGQLVIYKQNLAGRQVQTNSARKPLLKAIE